MHKNRVFWFGMHKVLVQTELPRLRQLGYEVFNPPYLSSVQDQSAYLEWDRNQTTTLPKEIFNKLANFNFFYSEMTEEIAEILNTYFGTVILTIEPLWLLEILKYYKGTIIYRVYGYYTSISKVLESLKAMHLISSRDNFWFVPHAIESVIDEDNWLRERERIVPYCLPQDIFNFANSWHDIILKNSGIAITCPNINNPFYLAHYRYLRKHFSEDYYKYYGVQTTKIHKPNLVGTLPREELILRLQQSSGYLYTYKEPSVCFLPPIEMMVLGGPVLYFSGCLLDKYVKQNSPGLCMSIEEARAKVNLFLKNDSVFINEVTASQMDVRQRYTPEYVWPIFDKTFRELIVQKNKTSDWLVVESTKLPSEKKRVYIFSHASFANIYETVCQILIMLVDAPNIEILVTAKADQSASIYTYIGSHLDTKNVRILCINPLDLIPPAVHVYAQKPSIFKVIIRKCFPGMLRAYFRKIMDKLFLFYQKIGKYKSELAYLNPEFDVFDWHINLINNDDNCSYVFIPHGYLFPEALGLNKNMILYVPDKNSKHMNGVNKKVVSLLSQKAKKVISSFKFKNIEELFGSH